MEKKINNDLAIVASQYLEGRFMTKGWGTPVLLPLFSKNTEFRGELGGKLVFRIGPT